MTASITTISKDKKLSGIETAKEVALAMLAECKTDKEIIRATGLSPSSITRLRRSMQHPPDRRSANVARWRKTAKAASAKRESSRIEKGIVPDRSWRMTKEDRAQLHARSLMKDIIDLGPTDCRFPTSSGPPHLFCGRPTEGASPYCPQCTRLAYTDAGRLCLKAKPKE